MSSTPVVSFRFTTVVRGGILYSGQGSISVAGGDQMWVAVNKTLLFEFSTDPNDVNVPCMSVNISAAAGTGALCVQLK